MDSSPSLSLFRVYPELQDKIPYTKLGSFPTPVQQLTGLGRELGLAQLYIKRDDLCHRLCGSNKVRKLEFFEHRVRPRQHINIVLKMAKYQALFGLKSHFFTPKTYF